MSLIVPSQKRYQLTQKAKDVCGKKRSYRRRAAFRAAADHSFWNGWKMVPYRCWVCKRWHLARAKP